MQETLRAVYRGGAFVPVAPCDWPEETEVEVRPYHPRLVPPKVKDPAERARRLRQLTERMVDHPLPPDAPKLTRDELHERR